MTKKYFEQPELQVVQIKKTDVIATSETLTIGSDLGTGVFNAAAAGRRYDQWYEGY